MYWNSLIIVAYEPQFSEPLKELIKEKITPSLQDTAKEGSGQYHLDEVKDLMMEYTWSIAFDLMIMMQAEKEQVQYFEL